MLQQTQIVRVIPKYEAWLKEFPSVEALSGAPFSRVLRAWQGMGYNRRARYLKDTVSLIKNNHGGIVPSDPRTLESLPGIGHYTARAVACFAYGAGEPFLETNIRRVLIHFFGDTIAKKDIKISDTDLLKILSEMTPLKNKKEWYWALMDYGRDALGKLPDNPNKKGKGYHPQSRFLGSRRYVRAKIISFLSQKEGGVHRQEIKKFLQKDPNAASFLEEPAFSKILESLQKEDLICFERGKWKVEDGH